MRNFNGFGGFVAFLSEASKRFLEAKHASLDAAGKIIEDEAKRVLGTYEYGWPPLAQSTIAGKANGDTPGLETSQLRDSIERTTTHEVTTIGTDEDRGVFFELGTASQPPRSFLVGALTHKEHEAMEACQKAFVKKLFGL